MTYLIDGHNLIGKLHDIALDDPDDEAKLVQKLAGFAAHHSTRCTVVFDKGNPGGRSRMSLSSVEVVFASAHSNADKVMIERIGRAENPRMMTVVSSDNDVLAAALRRRMQTLKSAAFAQMLEAPPPKPKLGPDLAPDVRLSEREVEEWMALFAEARKNREGLKQREASGRSARQPRARR
jgi:predicted RNA-binding protein with PIN domain